jgi:hypothetical protein
MNIFLFSVVDGIVNFLLESEADPRVRNRKRQTPYNVAQNADIKKKLQAVLNDPPPLIIRQPVVIFQYSIQLLYLQPTFVI